MGKTRVSTTTHMSAVYCPPFFAPLAPELHYLTHAQATPHRTALTPSTPPPPQARKKGSLETNELIGIWDESTAQVKMAYDLLTSAAVARRQGPVPCSTPALWPPQ